MWDLDLKYSSSYSFTYIQTPVRLTLRKPPPTFKARACRWDNVLLSVLKTRRPEEMKTGTHSHSDLVMVGVFAGGLVPVLLGIMLTGRTLSKTEVSWDVHAFS